MEQVGFIMKGEFTLESFFSRLITSLLFIFGQEGFFIAEKEKMQKDKKNT